MVGQFSKFARLFCFVVVGCLFTGTVVRADDDGAILNPTSGSTKSFNNNSTTDSTVARLNGKGRQASDKFNLDSGLVVFKVTNEGDSNFVMRLLDRNGKQIETLFNEIGPFNGERAFSIPNAGTCLLDVQSNGKWTAEARQPKATVGKSAPVNLAGHGVQTSPSLQLDKGLAVFKLNHNGESRFKVSLLDQDGRTVGYLVNTLGQFNGSKPLSIDKPGVYFLNVSADGDWSINVE
jgi:hypothetical protein